MTKKQRCGFFIGIGGIFVASLIIVLIFIQNHNSAKSFDQRMEDHLEVRELAKRNNVTFREGLNMAQVAEIIAENTFHTTEDVFAVLKDKEYIQKQIETYWFLSDEITNESIYYPLEGYLFPETYQISDKEMAIEDIFTMMLDHTGVVLEKYKDQIQESGHTVHEILTLASIVELESGKLEDRKNIASVFYNRMAINMELGSDVTTYYGAQVNMGDRDLMVSELNEVNGYNTRDRTRGGTLPVGAICNPSEESINCTLNAPNTKNLYFVGDKNGDCYFTETEEAHEAMIQHLQDSGLWYYYE